MLCNKALLLAQLFFVALLHLAPQHICSLNFLQHQEMIADTGNKVLLLMDWPAVLQILELCNGYKAVT